MQRTHVFVLVGVLLAGFVGWRVMSDVGQADITILGASLQVPVADTFMEQRVGLGKYDEPEDVPGGGLLFVFDEEDERTFWMKGMAFDLDVVWIRDGKVVAVQEDIPAPKKGEDPVSFTSEPLPIDMALELPAGSVDQLGILAGMPITVSLDGEVVIW